MSEKVKRYDTQSLLISSEVKPSEDGEYVRYYDYEALRERMFGRIDRYIAEIADLAARVEELEKEVEDFSIGNSALLRQRRSLEAENKRLREALSRCRGVGPDQSEDWSDLKETGE